jgi:hypothetical protein
MEGPYHYRGTLRGKPVSGFAFYERTLAMHRDWELVEVLATTLGEDSPLTQAVIELRELIGDGRAQEALDVLEKSIRPGAASDAQIVDDLVTVLKT